MLTLKRHREGEWVEFMEGVKFKIRPLTVSKQVELSTKCSHKVCVKEGKGRNERVHFVDEMDHVKLNQAILDHVLEDWSGIEIADGVDLTKEEIRLVIGDNHEVREFVMSKARELAGDREREYDEDLGN